MQGSKYIEEIQPSTLPQNSYKQRHQAAYVSSSYTVPAATAPQLPYGSYAYTAPTNPYATFSPVNIPKKNGTYGPIFGRCAMHIAISHYIQTNKKREAILIVQQPIIKVFFHNDNNSIKKEETMKKQKTPQHKEILEIPKKIENYNAAVDMITERGARMGGIQKSGENGIKVATDDVSKKLNFL